jgi:chromosome segregation ATPase
LSDKVQEIRELLGNSSDYAYDVIAERGHEYLSYLLSELDAAKVQRDKFRQEAKNERELSESIVAEREQLIIELDESKHDCNNWESEVNKLAQERHDLINEVDNYKDLLFDAKQENERLDGLVAEYRKILTGCRVLNQSLQQRLNQAIEALEDVRDGSHGHSLEYLNRTLSSLREEVNKPDTAAASLGNSVGSEQ